MIKMNAATKLIIFLFVFFISIPFVRIFTIPAPIYTPDEYAYWRHAVNMEYSGQAIIDFNSRDPLLQKVNNFLYQTVIHHLLSITHGNLTAVGIVQWFTWLTTLFLIYIVSKNLIFNHWKYAPVILASLMPFSNYTRSIMPEIFLGLGFWIASWSIIKLTSNHKYSIHLCILLGAICSIWIFIKIHSIAFAAAAGFTVIAIPFIHQDSLPRQEKVKYSLMNFFAFTTTFAFIRWLILLCYSNKIPSQDTSGVVGSFYLGIFNKNIEITEFISQTLFYIALHANVLLIFFSAGIIYSIMLSKTIIKSILTNRPHPYLAFISPCAEGLILFWFLNLIIHLLMIAFFSTFTGIDNPFEYGRIHERYYWYAIPALIIITMLSLNYRAKLFIFLSFLLAISSLIFFFLITVKHASIYPWDAPDFFGLYQKTSNWEYISPIPLLPYLIGLFIIAYSFSLFGNSRISLTAYSALMTTLFVASYIAASPWQYETSKNSFNMYSEGRAVSKTINPAANVLIVSNERYGPTSNFMMGFNQSPYFMLTDQQAIIDFDPIKKYDLVAISKDISYIGTIYEKHPAELSNFILYTPKIGP